MKSLCTSKAVVRLVLARDNMLSRHRPTLHHASFVLFVFAVFAAPLPFGSTDAQVVSVWICLLASSLICAERDTLARPHLLAVATLQVLALAFVVQASLRGHVEIPIRTDLPELPQMLIASPKSIAELGPVTAAMLALAAGIVHGRHVSRARTAIMVVGLTATLIATYGIVSNLIDPTLILWRARTDYVGVVLGTFTYRNTAATYFGCCSTLWLLFLCEDVFRIAERYDLGGVGLHTKIVFIAQRISPKRFGWRVAAFTTCFLALAMTNSRAGIILSLFTMMLGAMIVFRKPILQAPFSRKIGIGGTMAILAMTLARAAEHRFDEQGFADEGRFDVYRATLAMIADHPLAGIGLGAFKTDFPVYRAASSSIWGIWDIAHSTPLELAAEVGVPLAGFAALAYIAATAALIRGAVVRRQNAIIPLTSAAFAVIGGLHSIVDFPLQIPGFAIVCMAMIGIGLAQAFRSDHRSQPMARVNQAQSPKVSLPSSADQEF